MLRAKFQLLNRFLTSIFVLIRRQFCLPFYFYASKAVLLHSDLKLPLLHASARENEAYSQAFSVSCRLYVLKM